LELQQMVAVTISKNMYLQSIGPRAMAALHAQQLCMNSSADTIKYKIRKLINFHVNLDLWSSIIRALAEHPSIEIFILVKLNQFTALRDGPSHINKNKHAKINHLIRKEEEEKTAQEAYF
ncbi:hypothetical protein BD310DRAFT_833367, partial [Dichomitus squalens]